MVETEKNRRPGFARNEKSGPAPMVTAVPSYPWLLALFCLQRKMAPLFWGSVAGILVPVAAACKSPATLAAWQAAEAGGGGLGPSGEQAIERSGCRRCHCRRGGV
jgi:hypothetical protein